MVPTAIFIRTADTVAEEKGTGSTRKVRGTVVDPGTVLIAVIMADLGPDPDTVEGAGGSGRPAIPTRRSLGDPRILNLSEIKNSIKWL
jgi:hypothetical protein